MNHINYENILLVHNKSVLASRSEADISARLGERVFATPVMCSNMKSVLTPDIVKLFDRNNWFYVYHRINGPEDVHLFAQYANNELSMTSISVGVTKEWRDCIRNLSADNIKLDYITIDVALSYNDNILQMVYLIQMLYPEAYLIVGNGATPEWIKWLIKLDVDCAKVGIGTSKACRTRQFTGFGSSTITSLEQCDVARTSLFFGKPKIQLISDGGIRVGKDNLPYIGDIVSAIIVGGADWVMSGALFSRCIDSPAIKNGYFGNASADGKGHFKHIEGTNVTVQSNKLTIKEMMNLVEDSLRSAVSYSGGKNISEMKKLTKWVQI